jgi:hypothetical protein
VLPKFEEVAEKLARTKGERPQILLQSGGYMGAWTELVPEDAQREPQATGYGSLRHRGRNQTVSQNFAASELFGIRADVARKVLAELQHGGSMEARLYTAARTRTVGWLPYLRTHDELRHPRHDNVTLEYLRRV